MIDFHTILTIKSTGQEIRNTIKLNAIRQEKLQDLLIECGFDNLEYFGTFESKPLQNDSLTLIVSCKKQEKISVSQ
jgi:glycine/sarcosine N-methyltransferase